MGIRFACHVCTKRLNIKHDLAGKRGICPACSAKFRIPLKDAEKSIPIEEKPIQPKTVQPKTIQSKTVQSKTVQPKPASQPAQEPKVEFDLLTDDPDATWYVRPPSGGQYGPADSAVLRQWIDQGRVAASSLLWRDGWANWKSAEEVLPGLALKRPTEIGNTGWSGNSEANQPDGNGLPPAIEGNGQRAQSASDVANPNLTGRSDIGTQRRQRSGTRILLIGVLTAIAITLLGVLVYLMK